MSTLLSLNIVVSKLLLESQSFSCQLINSSNCFGIKRFLTFGTIEDLGQWKIIQKRLKCLKYFHVTWLPFLIEQNKEKESLLPSVCVCAHTPFSLMLLNNTKHLIILNHHIPQLRTQVYPQFASNIAPFDLIVQNSGICFWDHRRKLFFVETNGVKLDVSKLFLIILWSCISFFISKLAIQWGLGLPLYPWGEEMLIELDFIGWFLSSISLLPGILQLNLIGVRCLYNFLLF